MHRLRQGRARGPALTTRGATQALLVAAIVVAADQASKGWVLDHERAGPHHLIGPLGVDVGRNTGVAFSLFAGHADVSLAISLVLTAVVLVCAVRAAPGASSAVFGLLLGGGLGNDIDRVARRGSGGVVDFLTLPHWATFNVADAAITLGIAGLAVLVVLRRRLFGQA